MAKAKMYGMTTTYIPNARADMRFRKKLYQHNREVAKWVPCQRTKKSLLDQKKGNE